jgi:hypothetical protein
VFKDFFHKVPLRAAQGNTKGINVINIFMNRKAKKWMIKNSDVQRQI